MPEPGEMDSARGPWHARTAGPQRPQFTAVVGESGVCHGRNPSMKEVDRRRLVRGILFGAAAAGLALAPGAATPMPLDDRLPGALDDWIEKAQAVVVTSGPRRRHR